MTAKLVLDTRYQSKSKNFPIVIRIRSGNQLKHIATGYKIPETAWGKGEVKKNYPDAQIYNTNITKQLAAIKTKLLTAKGEGITDLELILADKKPTALLFSDYLEHRAKQYDEEKKLKHARKVRRYLSNLQECFGKKDIPFNLSADDMRTFNAYLLKINDTNTIAHKFSKLAQLFNNALKERKTDAENVFENFKAPTKPANREKLTKEEIATIEKLVLLDGIINDSRNLFLFSYYCKGMRFEDCIRLKPSDITKERIIFREIKKGHKMITVQIHPKLKALIELYINNKTPYLLPFLKEELIIDRTGKLTEEAAKERISKVEAQNTIVNRNLKVVIAAAGITKDISMHNSRHSFAYNMKKNGANINIIKDALGHGDTKTTEMYLKSLDDEAIDNEVNKLYE